MRSILSCLLLLALAMCINSQEDQARLLASKNIHNQLLVEGKDLTVEYNIYNVGGRLVNYCVSKRKMSKSLMPALVYQSEDSEMFRTYF